MRVQDLIDILQRQPSHYDVVGCWEQTVNAINAITKDVQTAEIYLHVDSVPYRGTGAHDDEILYRGE